MFESKAYPQTTTYAFQVGDGLAQARLALQHKILEHTTYNFLKDNITPNMNVFEFGCGTGETTKLIANLIKNGQVHAVDKNQEQIKCATKSTVSYSFVEYSVLDIVADEIKFKGKFDSCYGRYVIEHVRSQDRTLAIKNCLSTLTEGGVFLLEEGDLNKIFYNSNHPAVDRLAELYKELYTPLGLSLNLVSEIPEILKQNGYKVDVKIVTPMVSTKEHLQVIPMTCQEMAPLFKKHGLFKYPNEEKDLQEKLTLMVDEPVEISYTDNHQIRATLSN